MAAFTPRKRIVVLGGGSGGVAAAATLGEAIGREHEVILVDRQPLHVYLPALLFVMTGERTPQAITRHLSLLERHGVKVLLANVYGIEPAAQVVHIDGGKLPYDYLVISLGLETHPEAVPGFVAGAHHAWELAAAVRCRDALARFEGGRLVVAQAPGPYRCPPAPFEALFSIDADLRRRGLRHRSELHLLSPIPVPTGDPRSPTPWLAREAAARGASLHWDFVVTEIDADQRTVRATDGRTFGYDFLFMVPPHRPAQVLLDSGIAGPAGVAVDYDDLTTGHEHVWAIGDCADFPASKAGVVAHQQADLVAHNVIVSLTGRGEPERFRLHTI